MDMYEHLKIDSENPELRGKWNALDVYLDMEDLGMTPAANDWIEYIIGHFDFPSEIDDAITNDSITHVVFMFHGDKVEVTKE